MKLLSRHTVVVLLIAACACLGGLALSVVAFGQTSSTTGDYTTPLGDYTTTTPATVPSTTPARPVTTQSSPPRPARRIPHGRTVLPTTTRSPIPSRTTRPGPTTRLAFTGAEPVLVGLGGAALMLAGLGLHRRRRRLARLQA